MEVLIKILGILFTPIPVWTAVPIFAVGIIIGILIRMKYDKSDVFQKVRLEAFVQVVVFILWTAATARAVFYDGVDYPPLFLNLFFGTVVGSVNKSFGEYLISLAKAVSPKK